MRVEIWEMSFPIRILVSKKFTGIKIPISRPWRPWRNKMLISHFTIHSTNGYTQTSFANDCLRMFFEISLESLVRNSNKLLNFALRKNISQLN